LALFSAWWQFDDPDSAERVREQAPSKRLTNFSLEFPSDFFAVFSGATTYGGVQSGHRVRQAAEATRWYVNVDVISMLLFLLLVAILTTTRAGFPLSHSLACPVPLSAIAGLKKASDEPSAVVYEGNRLDALRCRLPRFIEMWRVRLLLFCLFV
jgi:hypothetical protein